MPPVYGPCFYIKTKNVPKNLHTGKKPYLCTAFEQCTGLWCNGNTADSGPAFPGSSPGSPAKKETPTRLFFCGWATRTRTRKGSRKPPILSWSSKDPEVSVQQQKRFAARPIPGFQIRKAWLRFQDRCRNRSSRIR